MNDLAIANAVARLDRWFETMRSSDGYCGPISHWWESCLLYSGAMIDWRYEGILCGYVQLYERTGNLSWLERAICAGEDVRRGQLSDGRFRNSNFQAGPMEGGTPHEAAVDVGLLMLARTLRASNDSRWEIYYQVAEKNLLQYQIACLWNGSAFRDQPWNQTLVPNKNATTAEALLLYEELSGKSMEQYIRGAVALILSAQVHEATPYQGATVHLGTHKHRLTIGIYTARCAAALVKVYEKYGEEKHLRSAQAMAQFLLTLVAENGTFFGYYPNGKRINCPIWVSPSGDVLRALVALEPYGNIPAQAIEQLVEILLTCQTPSGGMPTSYGLGEKGSTKPPQGRPDFRDVLPVVGWCDKAFRALTLLSPDVPVLKNDGKSEVTQVECTWKNQKCLYVEDNSQIALQTIDSGKTLYRWVKGNTYPVETLL